MRLFLDANVLFTAAHSPRGKAAFIVKLSALGHWQLFTSKFAVEEASRNLVRKYPQAMNNLDEILPLLGLVGQYSGSKYPIGLNKKDQPIFQAALTCQATHLLTGDLKDFGPFMNKPQSTSGVCIQTVADFLNKL